jgi:hypothetical protein
MRRLTYKQFCLHYFVGIALLSEERQSYGVEHPGWIAMRQVRDAKMFLH